MSASKHSPERLTKDVAHFVQWNARDIAELPEPGQIWMHRDIETDIKPSHLMRFSQYGVINCVERVSYDGQNGEAVGRWQTDKQAYEKAIERVECEKRDAALPCGHNAIKNERGVEGITCGACGSIHKRSEVSL